jgi:hypothetical protein
MQISRLAFICFALSAAPAVHAAGLGLRLGSTGIGGDIGFTLSDSLTARVGYAGYRTDVEIDEQDVRYEGKLKWSNLSGVLDWYFLGKLRLTGGIYSANNKVDVTGTPNGGTYTINGQVYNASDVGTLKGSTRLGKSASPYIGIGYGDITRPGINLFADLGVMYQGSPKVSLTATCGASLPAPQCTQLQTDTAAEERKINDDIKSFKYYPVFQAGIAYGF